jgi:hypothetical protein
MKKLIIGSLTAVLLGVVLLTVNIGFSSGSNGLSSGGFVTSSSTIRYIVTVHPPADNNICGAYQVVMLNGAGDKVAPPRIYQPGKPDYVFYEIGPVRLGYRIARLIPVAGVNDNTCIYPLRTPPDVQRNNFQNGETYNFNLYPETQLGKPN